MGNSRAGLILGLCLISASLGAKTAQADCSYTYDPTAVQIGWTAYKTTAKIPVHGNFKTCNVQGPVTGSDIPTLLNAISVDIDTNSVATGNPTRDTNIMMGFFKYVKGYNIHGRFRRAVGDAQQGTLTLALEINGHWGHVPLTYAIGSDGKFTAIGTFDVLHFGMADALARMNETCAEYHTGPDGVSKTWSTIDLALTVPVTATCPAAPLH